MCNLQNEPAFFSLLTPTPGSNYVLKENPLVTSNRLFPLSSNIFLCLHALARNLLGFRVYAQCIQPLMFLGFGYSQLLGSGYTQLLGSDHTQLHGGPCVGCILPCFPGFSTCYSLFSPSHSLPIFLANVHSALEHCFVVEVSLFPQGGLGMPSVCSHRNYRMWMSPGSPPLCTLGAYSLTWLPCYALCPWIPWGTPAFLKVWQVSQCVLRKQQGLPDMGNTISRGRMANVQLSNKIELPNTVKSTNSQTNSY